MIITFQSNINLYNCSPVFQNSKNNRLIHFFCCELYNISMNNSIFELNVGTDFESQLLKTDDYIFIKLDANGFFK